MTDEVEAKHLGCTITKQDKPIAENVSMPQNGTEEIFGCMANTGAILWDIIGPIKDEWEAN